MATEPFSAVCNVMNTTPGVSVMDPLDQPQWYALRTRSRHEKMVSDQLLKQGIESFLPVQKHTHKWSDRTKEVELPVFAGYSFVRMIFSSRDRLRVLQTPGVAGFVGIRYMGIPIPESQIEDIRTVLASGLPFEERTFLQVGQRVRIRGGSLDGIEGILSAHEEDRSLVVSVELIQRSLSVRIQGYAVEAV